MGGAASPALLWGCGEGGFTRRRAVQHPFTISDGLQYRTGVDLSDGGPAGGRRQRWRRGAGAGLRQRRLLLHRGYADRGVPAGRHERAAAPLEHAGEDGETEAAGGGARKQRGKQLNQRERRRAKKRAARETAPLPTAGVSSLARALCLRNGPFLHETPLSASKRPHSKGSLPSRPLRCLRDEIA